MKNNADVDFVITDADMKELNNAGRIKDYGNACMTPVFGGKLSLAAMVKPFIGSRRKKD